MGEYHIYGGNKLYGETSTTGAKNAVLPILSASILNKGITVLKNVPKLSDVYVCIEILELLGCKVVFNENTLEIDSTEITTTTVDETLVRKMRSSIIFLGALLARFNECTIGYPGGYVC